MTGQQPEIQWYIAREGKQHGPLSDAEMRTFVAQGHLKPTDLIWRAGFADWRPAPAVFPFKGPESASQPTATRQPEPREPARVPPQSAERSFEPDRIHVAKTPTEHEPRRLGRVLGLALVILLLAGAGTGAWYFIYQKGGIPVVGPSEIADGPSEANTAVSETETAASETTTAAIAPAETPPAGPAPVVSAVPPEVIAQNAQKLDAQFQKIGLWSLVKREFPDWYGKRLNEAAKLSAENQPQGAITKHMTEALVALRRKHADKALAASTEKLKNVATAFLANLKSLRERSDRACFGFISKGETAPVVLELLQSPEKAATVHAQTAAIFEAIAEGRKAPTTHKPAVKSDYEALVKQLAKLGWKETDLQIFSNPKALANQPPRRVCQMVQDWFVAHLAVEDQPAQERLLVETLKPVVSG
ncbi:MAG: DUF4339 domain-containing protein [Hyphomicrobium sp.]